MELQHVKLLLKKGRILETQIVLSCNFHRQLKLAQGFWNINLQRELIRED